ncbi:MAG: hypothetical protein ACE5I8_05065 [Thermodesulfobacteriota bacterium]
MKRSILYLLILSFFLSACFPMVRKSHQRETYRILVTIHYWHPDEIREEYAKSLSENGLPVDAFNLPKVGGFAEWNESNRKDALDIRTGTIYVPKPLENRSDPKVERIIGHEIRHIIDGYFHK